GGDQDERDEGDDQPLPVRVEGPDAALTMGEMVVGNGHAHIVPPRHDRRLCRGPDVHDVPGAEGVDPAAGVHLEAARAVHAGGAAGEDAVAGQLDPYVAAHGGGDGQVGGAQPAGVGVAARLAPLAVVGVDLAQHGPQQRVAVETGGLLHGQGGGG